MGRSCVDKERKARELSPRPSGHPLPHFYQTLDTCLSSAGQRECGTLSSDLWAALTELQQPDGDAVLSLTHVCARLRFSGSAAAAI